METGAQYLTSVQERDGRPFPEQDSQRVLGRFSSSFSRFSQTVTNLRALSCD